MSGFRLTILLPLALLLAAPLQLTAQSSSDGPRPLSEADQAKIRESMAKGKTRRAQELRQAEQQRQAEQARQQEAQRLAAIEAQRVADEEAAEDEEASSNSGGTGAALLHGLETLQSEVNKNQAEQRRQQKFLDKLERRSQAQPQAQQQAQIERAQVETPAQQQSAQASAVPKPSAEPLAQEQRNRELREA